MLLWLIMSERSPKTTRRVGNRPVPTSVAAKLQLLICTVLMVFIAKKRAISCLFLMVTPRSLIINMAATVVVMLGRNLEFLFFFLRFELHNHDISTIEPFRSILNTDYITGLDMCKVCTRSSPFRSTLNTGYITGLDMCKVCTRSSPFRSTLNTGYITGLDMCKVCTRSSPFRSTLNTGYITGLDMCKVCTRSSPFRSTLNTGYITGLDMCKVCTRSSPFRSKLNTGCITGRARNSPLRRTLNHGHVRRKEVKMQVGFQPVGKNNRTSIYDRCREQGHEHIHNVCLHMRYVFAVIFVQVSWLCIRWLTELTDVTATGLLLQRRELGNIDFWFIWIRD